MMWPMAARLALALLAVAAIGWLGLSYRSVEHQEEAEATLQKPLAEYLKTGRSSAVPPAELRRATDRIDAAKRLNPDSTLDLDRGSLHLLSGEEAKAADTFQDVVDREPQNLQAWLALAFATRDTDRARARRATRRADALNPIRSGR